MKKTVTVGILLALLAFIAVMTVLGCQKIHQNEIVYDGQTITWNSVPFAKHYELSINGGAPIVCEEPSYSYPDGGDFDIAITVRKALFPDSTEEKNFRYLQTVEGLHFQNGVLYWSPVEGADSYTIEVNGVEVATVTETRFAYNGSQDAIFRVKPNSNDAAYYSMWSAPYSAYILQTPQNVRYDHAARKLLWDAVDRAISYTVWINGYPLTQNQLTNNCDFFAGQSQFTVQVQANGDPAQQSFDSLKSPVLTYTYQAAPANLRVENGAVAWDAAPGAVAYRVLLNGADAGLTANTYFDNLSPNTAYQISVLALNNNPYAYSDYVSLTCTILPKPTLAVSYAANKVTFSWQGVEGAQGYTLHIVRNGVTAELLSLGNVLSYEDYDFAQSGSYQVALCASQTADASASAWSNAIAVTRLAAVTGASVQTNGTVSFTPADRASHYTVKVGAATVLEQELTQNSFSLVDRAGFTQTGAMTLTIESKVATNVVSESELILPATEVCTLTVTKANRVTGASVTTTGVSWNTVANAQGYIVSISYQNGQEVQYPVAAGVTTLAQTWEQIGTYRVRVQALCAGTNAIVSDSARTRDVVRLGAPVITLENEELQWTQVEGANGYSVQIDDQLPVSSVGFNLRDYATSSKRTVRVYATKTGGELVISTPSNALEFATLTAPQTVQVNDQKIVWSPVEGADRYQVLINGAAALLSPTTACEINHPAAMQTDGREYKIQIIAISDDAAFLSATSGEVKVYRLSKPNVLFHKGTAELYWSLPTSLPSGYAWDKVLVTQDGDSVSVASRATAYTLTGIEAGVTYTVEVQFKGNEAASLTQKGTISSSKGGFSFTAKTCPTPVLAGTRYGGRVSLWLDNYTMTDTSYINCEFVINEGTASEQRFTTEQGAHTSHDFTGVSSNATCRVRVEADFLMVEGGEIVYYCDSAWSSSIVR